MPLSVTSFSLGSAYPLLVCAQGGNGIATTNIAATAGSSFYYGASNTVSSSSNLGTVTQGSSVNVSTPTWIISAGTTTVTTTDYPGGGTIETLFAGWVPIKSVAQVPLAGATSAAQYVMTGTLNTFVAVAGAATGQGMFYLDPGNYNVSDGRTPKLRIRGDVTTNAVAPACTNLVYSLCPVATVGGASGAVPTIATVSAATTSVTIATPNATTQTVAYGASTAFPAAGWYCFTLTVGTGGTAANANTVHGFELQVDRTAP